MIAILLATFTLAPAAEMPEQSYSAIDGARSAERIESLRQRVTATEDQNLRTMIQAQAIVAQQAEMRAQLAEMSWMLRGLIVGLAGLMVEALSRFWLARKE